MHVIIHQQNLGLEKKWSKWYNGLSVFGPYLVAKTFGNFDTVVL